MNLSEYLLESKLSIYLNMDHVLVYSFFFFPITFIVLSLLFSLPPSRKSDRGSYSRLISPRTHYGSCPAFLSRDDFSSFLPRRRASNCAHPREALSAVAPFFFLQINSKSCHGGIRTHRPTLVAFEGYLLSTGAATNVI